MIRRTVLLLLAQLAERLCGEHIPLIGTDPTVCARCWKVLGQAPLTRSYGGVRVSD